MNVLKALDSIFSMCNLNVILLPKIITRYFALFTNGTFFSFNVRRESGGFLDFCLKFEVWGHVTTDGQSVSTSWRQAHLGTCDQILILSEFCCLVSLERPLWREVESISCQSLSAITVHSQGFCLFFFSFHFTRHAFYVYTIYARPSRPRLSTADHVPSLVAYTRTAV
jgi:hypothetical protein